VCFLAKSALRFAQVVSRGWEIAVPLTAYLEGGVFEPQQIGAMTAAFEAVCRSLQLADRTDPLIEIVARKVIEIAATGERNPDRLRVLVLEELSGSHQHSA
jgi:hypothetical protein